MMERPIETIYKKINGYGRKAYSTQFIKITEYGQKAYPNNL